MLADPEGNEFCVIEAGNNFLADCGFIGALSGDGSQAVGYFWSAALGWPLVWDQDEETAIRSPHGGPKITWGGPPLTPKTGKNRVHLDLAPPADGDQQARSTGSWPSGRRRVDIGQGDGRAGWSWPIPTATSSVCCPPATPGDRRGPTRAGPLKWSPCLCGRRKGALDDGWLAWVPAVTDVRAGLRARPSRLRFTGIGCGQLLDSYTCSSMMRYVDQPAPGPGRRVARRGRRGRCRSWPRRVPGWTRRSCSSSPVSCRGWRTRWRGRSWSRSRTPAPTRPG